MTVRCRSWGCEVCQPRRRAQLRSLAASGEPTTFLTLTCRAAQGTTPVQNARKLVEAWRELRKRIKKRWHVDKLPFLAVFEAHKSGWPHLHILARVKYIPQPWIAAQMQELLNSPIVDIRLIKNKRMASIYVAKYVGKQPGHFDTLKRYWHSQDWRKDKKKKPELLLWYCEALKNWQLEYWEVSQRNIGQIYRDLLNTGWRVTWHGLDRISADRDFRGSG